MGQQPGQRPGQDGQQPGQRPGQDGQQPGQGMGQDGQQPGQRLGQQTGQVPNQQQILQFAQTIEQDHQQAIQQLRQVAQQVGVEISETPELSPVHRAKLDELREKQGEELARAWVFGQVAGHTYAILEYSWASQNAPSREIQQHAQQALPKLQQHAQMTAPVAYQMADIQGGQSDRDGSGQGQDRSGGGMGGDDRPGGGSGSGGAGGGGVR